MSAICGSWVYAPDDLLISRLVCTRDPGHDGEHEAGRRWVVTSYVWVWADKYSEPRQVPLAVERERAAGPATKADGG